MRPDPEHGFSSPPLADVLLAAAEAVSGVLAGRSLTDTLTHTPAALRPAAQAVSFHVMRRLGLARALREALVPRTPPSALLDALLLTTLALLDTATRPADEQVPGAPRYTQHTLVDQAVRAAASRPALLSYKGLVNGSLRRFLRERDALLAQVGNRLEARWNTPDWWVKQLQADYPKQWQALLAAADQQGPLTLRINRRRATRDTVAAALLADGMVSAPVGTDGLVLDSARPVTRLPGFAEGWWSVQDAGAQLAAPLLTPRDGMRVLDACAAPGGKTAHLLELADVELLALDNDAARLDKVGTNLQRLGLLSDRVQLQAADAGHPDDWWDGRPFDAVLADVPCTASGIVRRHPDIRWLRRADDLRRTARTQARITDALWRVVASGGTLLYATCSIFPLEGEQQAAAFAARHPDAKRLPAPGQLLPAPVGSAAAEQHDGFFYALFGKD